MAAEGAQRRGRSVLPSPATSHPVLLYALGLLCQSSGVKYHEFGLQLADDRLIDPVGHG